jgi:hypothetical protein
MTDSDIHVPIINQLSLAIGRPADNPGGVEWRTHGKVIKALQTLALSTKAHH